MGAVTVSPKELMDATFKEVDCPNRNGSGGYTPLTHDEGRHKSAHFLFKKKNEAATNRHQQRECGR